MAFSATWRTVFNFDPNSGRPALFITGTSRNFTVDWGDGTTSTVKFLVGSDDDGVYSGLTPYHRYAQGSYQVSVTPLGSGRADQSYSVTMASAANVDLRLSGSSKIDYIHAGNGADSIRGGDGNDLLLGGSGDDRLLGGGRSSSGLDEDVLYGGYGNDALVGGVGDDRLQGDNGVDRLRGGDGQDVFVFVRPLNADGSAVLGSDNDADTVVDFQQGIHLLDVSGWELRRSFVFIGESQFTGERGSSEVRAYQTALGNTIVEGDRDADGVADFQIRLLGEYQLTTTDFIL